jgi:hypothetical protein
MVPNELFNLGGRHRRIIPAPRSLSDHQRLVRPSVAGARIA